MRRALLIDDDVCIHDLVALALSTRGWDVVTAISAELGIQSALANPPDAILLDVHIPPTNGPAILADIRTHAELRDVPVIFLTADSGERTGVEGGAIGAISKPFDPKNLAHQIEDMLHR